MRRPSAEDLLRAVAGRIADARRSRGLTQAVLADRLGIAVQNLKRIESGAQNLTLRTLHRVSEALAVDVAALIPAGSPLLQEPDDRLAGLLAAGWRRPDTAARPATPVVPAYDVAAMAGEPDALRTASAIAALMPPAGRRFLPDGLFLVQARGSSMAPLVGNGAWCLLRQPASPPLLGKIVLVHLRGPDDSGDVGGWQLKRIGRQEWTPHGVEVRLDSLRRNLKPASLLVRGEMDLLVLGELVEVVG